MEGDNGLKSVGDGLYTVVRTEEQRQQVYMPTPGRLAEVLFRDNRRSTVTTQQEALHSKSPVGKIIKNHERT